MNQRIFLETLVLTNIPKTSYTILIQKIPSGLPAEYKNFRVYIAHDGEDIFACDTFAEALEIHNTALASMQVDQIVR